MANDSLELIDPEVLQEIKKIAHENNMSLEQLFRWLIFGYKEYKKENNEKQLYD